jgi:hypothetical protein
MFNYVPIKHKQMSFLSNGGKFKLYTVLNALIFPTAAQPRISFERAIQQATLFGEKCGNCLLYLLVEFSCFFWLRASSYIVSHRSNLVQMNFPCPLVILDIDATLKHNKRGHKAICTRFEWWETM